MAAQNFKLFLGRLGDGVTVCNSAVMENGDFKMVAHISVEGKITWYVSEDYPPADALASIRACAKQERVRHQEWLNSLSPLARQDYLLNKLSPGELFDFLTEIPAVMDGGRVCCGSCGAELVRDKSGDMPETCSECGRFVCYSEVE